MYRKGTYRAIPDWLHQRSRFGAHSLLEHAIGGHVTELLSCDKGGPSPREVKQEKGVTRELRFSIYAMGGLSTLRQLC